MNFLGMGGPEIVVIAVIAFLLLGPKGVRDGSRTLGKLVRDLKREGDEFQKAISEAADFEEDEETERQSAPVPPGAVARSNGPRPSGQQGSGGGAVAPELQVRDPQGKDPQDAGDGRAGPGDAGR